MASSTRGQTRKVPRPKEIKVGHCRYQIIWMTEEKWLQTYDSNKTGLFLGDEMSITIRCGNQGMPIHDDALRETLLHEILHACWLHANMSGHGVLDKEEVEEWAVGCLTWPLLAVLAENPNLVAYLINTGQPG